MTDPLTELLAELDALLLQFVVDAGGRFERAGWKVLFFPGAECVHVGGASHGGRMFRENVRGHLRFLAKHRGVRYAERARRLLGWSLRLRARLFRDERGRMYRDAADWLSSGRMPELLDR